MPSLPRKKTSIFASPILLVCISLVTIYVLFQFVDVFSKKKYTDNLLAESKAYNLSLQRSLGEVEERSALLDNERGREAFLREKEGFLLPGEEVYAIVDLVKIEATSSPKQKESWWRKIIPFY